MWMRTDFAIAIDFAISLNAFSDSSGINVFRKVMGKPAYGCICILHMEVKAFDTC